MLPQNLQHGNVSVSLTATSDLAAELCIKLQWLNTNYMATVQLVTRNSQLSPNLPHLSSSEALMILTSSVRVLSSTHLGMDKFGVIAFLCHSNLQCRPLLFRPLVLVVNNTFLTMTLR